MTTEIRPPAAHQRPSGKMYLSADHLNLVHAAYTVVRLDAIAAGFGDGIEDVVNHRITPGRAGFYDIKGNVRYFSVVADRRYHSIIRINGVTNKASAASHSSIAEDLIIPCSTHIYLSATDYIELIAIQLAGVNTVDIKNGIDMTFLSVQRVR